MENFQNQHFDPNLIRGKANYLFCWKTLCWDMLSYTGHPFEITETGKLYEFTSTYHFKYLLCMLNLYAAFVLIIYKYEHAE